MYGDEVLAPVAAGIRMDHRTGVSRRRYSDVPSRSSTAEYQSKHEDQLREVHPSSRRRPGERPACPTSRRRRRLTGDATAAER
jgi:hypothetical protein